jgi:arabinofuranan 3-O-arabinosyltransferase
LIRRVRARASLRQDDRQAKIPPELPQSLRSYKPQYGLLFPIVLIAASQWTVFFTAAVVAVAMAFASWLAFGTESWQAFFHWMPMFSQAFLSEGKATWWKLQSLFSLVRYLGGSEQLAWACQWVLTASVATVLVVMWRSRISYSLKAAALAAGTLLTTPYLFMYDMMVLAIPVAFLVRVGSRTGFRPYELPALACALALFLTFTLTGQPTGALHHPDRRDPDPAPRWPLVAARAGAVADDSRARLSFDAF